MTTQAARRLAAVALLTLLTAGSFPAAATPLTPARSSLDFVAALWQRAVEWWSTIAGPARDGTPFQVRYCGDAGARSRHGWTKEGSMIDPTGGNSPSGPGPASSEPAQNGR